MFRKFYMAYNETPMKGIEMKILFKKKNYLLPHKTTNWAFVDGILCGVVVTLTVQSLLKDYFAIKEYDREYKEAREAEASDEPVNLDFK